MANLIEKLWDDNAGVKNENQFPEGRAIPCVITSLSTEIPDKNKKDQIRVILKLATLDGEDKEGNSVSGGRSGRITWDLYDIEYKDKKTGKPAVISGSEQLVRMMKDLDTLGFNTEEEGFDDIKDSINDEDSEPLYVYVNSKVNAGGYTNIYLSYLIPEGVLAELLDIEGEDDEEELQEVEDEETDGEEEEYEEDEDEDEEEDDDVSEEVEDDEEDYEEDYEEDEDEEEPFVPERGMLVTAKPNRTTKYQEYKVITCSSKKQTAKLKRVRDDKLFSEVSYELIKDEV